MDYVKYLQSKQWKDLKLNVINRDICCKLCGSYADLVVHHKTYDNKYNENLSDLVTLCKSCHSLVHKNNIITLDNIKILNNKTLEEIKWYEFEEFKNDKNNKFTFIDKNEFKKVRGKYAKEAYLLVREYKNLRVFKLKIENFKERFKIPESYTMSDIDKRILQRMISEINNKTNLNLTINKKKKRNRVTHLEFIIKEK